ncbi:hypothetical protein FGL86_03775 [Pistricoccus aurantiacus]|uniref:Uncharacterized protein n=1 Tax=Pistricoccus aurantiacus TaxID=1883414 RepID=A0A5B8SQN6_9GAMM|nr:hypothetical protein [Pistricoccus aurantiacus]QEA38277.1 hypothetical protein FGL86_03775 [Pistricoccus aurantiacus]
MTNLDPNYYRTLFHGVVSVNGLDVAGDWEVVYSTLDELIATTTDDDLPPSGITLDATKNLLIYADHLTIWKEIAAPGKSVKIVVNTLAAAPVAASAKTADVTINTTPPSPAQDIAPVPAATGLKNNATADKARGGNDGADAVDESNQSVIENGAVKASVVQERVGKKAGHIEVRCQRLDDSVGAVSLSAKGGRGAPGFNGQAGAPGETGTMGSEERDFNGFTHGPWKVTRPVTAGGDGGKGGAGVLGFPGGAGGNCEFVSVEAPKAAPTVDAAVGDSGADPKAPAVGGKGGFGGMGYARREKVNVNIRWPTTWRNEAPTPIPMMPSGKQGEKGALLQPVVQPVAQAGTVTVKQIAPDELGADSAFWLKLLQKTKNIYFHCYPAPDDDQDKYHDEKIWLKDRLGWMSSAIPVTDSPNPTAEDLRLRGLKRQADGLGYSLDSGWTVFGEPPNYVPRVGLDDLRATLKTQSVAFGEIETAFQTMVAAMESSSEAAIDHAKVLSALETQESRLSGRITGLTDVLNAAVTRLDSLETALDAARTALRQSIDTTLQSQLKKYFACEMDDVLKAAQSIAFSPDEAMGVVAGGQLLYDSATKIEGVDGVKINKDYLITKTVQLSEDIRASAVKAYNLSGKDLGNTALVTRLTDFETWLDKLPQSIPAATAVRSEIEDFKRQLRLRSATAIEYNTAIHGLRAAGGELIALRQRITDVRAKTAQASDPTLAGLASYLGAIYQELRNEAMVTVYQAYQAYHFQFLSVPRIAFDTYQDKLLWTQGSQPSSFSPADMDIVLSDLQTSKTAIKNHLKGDYTAFGTPHFPTQVSVTIDSPAMLAALRKDHALDFSTVPSSPGGKGEFVPLNTSDFADIRVTHVHPRFIGARTTKGHLAITVRHGNPDRFVTPEGHTLEFTHDAYRIPLTLDLAVPARQAYPWQPDEGRLDGGGYATLGLFTDWNIEITAADANDPTNEGLDLSDVTAVQVDFSGHYRVKNGA